MKRRRGAVVFVFLTVLVSIWAMAALGQAPQRSGSGKDTDETRIAELVTACHLLVDQAVLDSFGHVSVRSASDPKIFFMSRAMPPALVKATDIIKFSVDTGEPIDAKGQRVNGERYIHSETYKARPDTNCAVHSHALVIVPFGVAGVPLQPVIVQAGFLPPKTPVFDIRDEWGPDAKERGVLIRNPKHAAAMAKAMGNSPTLILRGHGINIVGNSVRQAVVRSVYTTMNARVQMDAMLLNQGKIIPLDEKELAYNPIEQFDNDRPWENYVNMLNEKEKR